MGPKIYLSIPEKSIDAILAKKIENFMDLDFGENCYEINLSEMNIRIFNQMIEIPSKKSRGNSESFLISIILDRNYNSDIIFNSLKEFKTDFSNKIQINENFSKSEPKLKELIASYFKKLSEILEKNQTDENSKNKFDEQEDKVNFLLCNLQKLTFNIANKNQFEINNFQLTEDSGRILIQIKLKGKGFLTGPLKKITLKSVFEGVEKYMISNGIPKDDFEIKINT